MADELEQSSVLESPNLQRYRRRLAGEQLRSELRYPLLLIGYTSIALTVFGVVGLETPAGWVRIVGGLTLGAVFIGLWRRRTWARWAASAAFASVVVVNLYNLIENGISPGSSFGLIMLMSMAVLLVQPSTTELIEAAAEAPEPVDQA